MSDQRVLVTGGSGFIGGAIADSYSDEAAVRILDVAPDDTAPADVEVIEGDVRDPATVDAAMEGVDVVFHEAARVSVSASVHDPLETHAINATGTLQVLEAAREHDARVVVASSAAVYGHPDSVPVAETDSLGPTSPYGMTKLSVDHYVRIYNELYDLETVALRYFNVYGPGQPGGDYAGVIDVFFDQARAGDPLTVHGDGQQTRDFVHVDDIVRANRLAATTDRVGTAFNVGTGDSVTIERLAEHVRDTVGADSPIVHTDPREGDIRHSRADTTRATEELGFDATVDLVDGLTTLDAAR